MTTVYVEPLRRELGLWIRFCPERVATRQGRAKSATSSIEIGSPCLGPCGKPLRPSGTTKKEYPGTVRHARGRVCDSCLNTPAGRAATVSLRHPPVRDGDPCVDCRTPLRRAGTPETVWPGSKPHKARGECGTCYRRNTRRTP